MKLYYYFVPWHSDARSFGVMADDQEQADALLYKYFERNGWITIVPAHEEKQEQHGQLMIVSPARPEQIVCDVQGWPSDYECWSFDVGKVVEFPLIINLGDFQG